MDDTQLLKGIPQGGILSVISRGETYGYEILSVLNEKGFENLIEGTLYPVLTRLEKKGLVSSRMGKSPLGPSRKYFSITSAGQEYLAGFIENYRRITDIAQKILIEEE